MSVITAKTLLSIRQSTTTCRSRSRQQQGQGARSAGQPPFWDRAAAASASATAASACTQRDYKLYRLSNRRQFCVQEAGLKTPPIGNIIPQFESESECRSRAQRENDASAVCPSGRSQILVHALPRRGGWPDTGRLTCNWLVVAWLAVLPAPATSFSSPFCCRRPLPLDA